MFECLITNVKGKRTVERKVTMPTFSQSSKDRLETCDPRLQKLFNEVIKYYDCTVECGYRGEFEQELAVRNGYSFKHFPNSKHNKMPSLAVDVNPYPWRWSRPKESIYFAGFVKGVASMMGIEIRCGVDWDSDKDLQDQTLNDYPHFEIE